MAQREGDQSSGRDALELMDEWFPPTPEEITEREECRADMDVAGLIYDARIAAGLTQAELAKRIGTSASAISRLEDYEYEGHSLAMLRRVAKALGKRVELRLVEATETGEFAVDQVPAVARKARVKRSSSRQRVAQGL